MTSLLTTTARALAVLLLASGCATTSAAVSPGSATPTGPTAPAKELRLGYFANVTHAGAVYGVASGTFAKELGSTELVPQTFNAGPAAVEAIFGGALDAAFLGPNPAVNAFVKSQGQAIRIVAGATSGGASLVVRKGITSAADLKGKKLASPQTGGSQDIALRTWLSEQGLQTDERGGGDVTIVAQDNAQTLALFRQGEIDGGWVPEPWASRLVLEGGATVLVDEQDRWPGGRFVSTHLVVRTDYLRRHPESVTALLRGLVEATRQVEADRGNAKTVINAALERLTGKALEQATMDRAFEQIILTLDPLATTLKRSAEHAFATGLLPETDLIGIYDLRLLERVLGRAVDDAGLGG